MTEAILEFKEGRYFSAIWYIEGGDKNWLCALWRDPGGAFQVTGRFRYYVDHRAHGSRDSRSEFSAAAKPGTMAGETSEADMLAKVDSIADGLIKAGFGGPVEKLILRTADVRTIFEQLRAQPWAHVKREGE